MSFLDPRVVEAHVQAEATKTGDALYNLGLMYSTGNGVEMDYIEAHKWFNLAALQGNSAARNWRTELADEMSTEEVATAQREAREWLSTH
jgi:TPR repeat protein